MARQPARQDATLIQGRTEAGIPTRAGGKARATPVPEQPYVIISCDNPERDIIALLGPEGAQVPNGYSRYGRVARPGKRDLTPFEGLDPFEMNLDLIFDGFASGRSVEPVIRQLEELASPYGRADEPPVITVRGPVPHSALTWRIAGSFDEVFEDTIYDRGERVRVHLLITLIQAIDDDVLTSSIQRSRRSGDGKGYRTTTVRAKEDRLTDVSRRLYDTPDRAREIAQANRITLGAKLKNGQKLKYP